MKIIEEKKHVIQRLPMDDHHPKKGGDFWPDVSTLSMVRFHVSGGSINEPDFLGKA